MAVSNQQSLYVDYGEREKSDQEHRLNLNYMTTGIFYLLLMIKDLRYGTKRMWKALGREEKLWKTRQWNVNAERCWINAVEY